MPQYIFSVFRYTLGRCTLLSAIDAHNGFVMIGCLDLENIV
jgi:uncharacterized protein YunC (DUF1805 family)